MDLIQTYDHMPPAYCLNNYYYYYEMTVSPPPWTYTAFASPVAAAASSPFTDIIASPGTRASYFDAYTYTVGDAQDTMPDFQVNKSGSPHASREPSSAEPNTDTSRATAPTEYNSHLPEDPQVMQALEIARESPEGADNETVCRILEAAIDRIWGYVLARPDEYILTRDQFAIFNYFQGRFKGNLVAVAARRRFWKNYRG